MIKKKTPLKKVLALGKECKECGTCCQKGSGFLAPEDLKKIAKHLGTSEEALKKTCLEETRIFNTTLYRPLTIKKHKPYGKCIFLKNNKCKVHKVKPLQCRLANCQEHAEKISLWFMLNYQVNPKDPESVRQYATYLKCSGKTLEGGKLNQLIKNKATLKKILNYEVLR